MTTESAILFGSRNLFEKYDKTEILGGQQPSISPNARSFRDPSYLSLHCRRMLRTTWSMRRLYSCSGMDPGLGEKRLNDASESLESW